MASGSEYKVGRGAYDTTATEHGAGEPVYHLQRRVAVLPFVRGFFGSPASGSYSHSLTMPNMRVVLAEMFVTNVRGNSQVGFACYAGLEEGGIRTLSGGQMLLQIDGPLAVQSNAVPPISCDVPRAIRDVFATVAEAPTGDPIRLRVTRDGDEFCDLTIEPGATTSQVVNGRSLPALKPGWGMGLDILATGQSATSSPGASLTVTIRF
jgi:hypothetical protein